MKAGHLCLATDSTPLKRDRFSYPSCTCKVRVPTYKFSQTDGNAFGEQKNGESRTQYLELTRNKICFILLTGQTTYQLGVQ